MMPLADAAVSRSEADWLVGINSTRALTSFNSRGGGFQKTTAGRVQTPTLAILAEREETHPQPSCRARISRCSADFQHRAPDSIAGAGSMRNLTPRKQPMSRRRPSASGRRRRPMRIEAKCAKDKPGIIEEEKKAASQISPQLYDLTTLQREANGRFGFPARMTLQIAQSLYEKHKALTYPRTDSRYLPEDHLETAKQVMGTFSGDLAKHAKKAMQSGWVKPNKRIFNNAKVSDHFAIVPTGTVPHGLDDKEAAHLRSRVEALRRGVLSGGRNSRTRRASLASKSDAFKTTGRIITDPGWMAVYGRETEGVDSEKADRPREGRRAGPDRRHRGEGKPHEAARAIQRRHTPLRDGRRGQARGRRGTPRGDGRARTRHARRRARRRSKA